VRSKKKKEEKKSTQRNREIRVSQRKKNCKTTRLTQNKK
jgi:hypothetical protein